MKIILDNSPDKLEITTPHGAVEIEVWPGGHVRPGGHTAVSVKPNLEHSDQCLRSDDSTRIVLKAR